MNNENKRPKRKDMPDVSGLDTRGTGEYKGLPTHEQGWKLYQRGVAYNASIGLNDTVKANENFFVGKQWEGVQANGLPTPVFNILKRVGCFTVATISSDNIKIAAAPLSATARTKQLIEPARILNEELDALTEINKIPALMREFARNAAVDGDGCTYTYWDPDEETGQDAKGAIKTEIVDNTRVFFGNPNDRKVQTQPYIIIESRAILGEVKMRAKENGFDTWADITTDNDSTAPDAYKDLDDKVTLLLLLWRDKKTKHIWAYEFTQKSPVREAWDMGIKLYPVTWLNWDYIQNSYHGQAMVTGLIPNQIFINRSWAMSQLSLMTSAYPKTIYDKTRIAKWDNRIGAAIGINGGDVNSVARNIDPATISPQVSQFIRDAIEQTEESLGATSVALGDTRPDNTSAIIALQRAAATPSEITKQNLFQSIEDLYRIYLEFITEYYGTRSVDIPAPEQLAAAYQMAGQNMPSEITVDFDFSSLKNLPMRMKLDVGASSYYSEIASIQTLDNLLRNNQIDVLQYLERIPDGYIPARRELIEDIKSQRQAQQMQQMQMAQQQMQMAQPGAITEQVEAEEEVPTGGGYSALQRKVNETGTTEGLV